MALESPLATEPVYQTGPDGVRRLVAAPGDVIPGQVPAYGLTRRQDPVVTDEPLDGYDAMTEAAIVALLPSLDTQTLEAVQAYERVHLARGAIHQYGLTTTVVRGGGRHPKTDKQVSQRSVAEGYDGLTDDELVAEVGRRELTVTTTGGAAKVRKARIAALVADDASDSTGPVE